MPLQVELDHYSGAAWDGRSRVLYLFDGTGGGRVVAIDSRGKLLRTIGRSGGGPGEFVMHREGYRLTRMALSGPYLFVLDRRGVTVFDTTGRYIDMAPLPGMGPIQLGNNTYVVADGPTSALVAIGREHEVSNRDANARATLRLFRTQITGGHLGVRETTMHLGSSYRYAGPLTAQGTFPLGPYHPIGFGRLLDGDTLRHYTLSQQSFAVCVWDATFAHLRVMGVQGERKHHDRPEMEAYIQSVPGLSVPDPDGKVAADGLRSAWPTRGPWYHDIHAGAQMVVARRYGDAGTVDDVYWEGTYAGSVLESHPVWGELILAVEHNRILRHEMDQETGEDFLQWYRWSTSTEVRVP